MDKIAQTEDCEIWMGVLSAPLRFVSPFGDKDFALMIVVNDRTISLAERDAFCKEVIRQNGRSIHSVGYDCEAWHDAFDDAYLAFTGKFGSGDASADERLVMTSWHADGPLSEAVFELLFCSTVEDWPTRFLILLIGENDRAREEILAAIMENGFANCDLNQREL